MPFSSCSIKQILILDTLEIMRKLLIIIGLGTLLATSCSENNSDNPGSKNKDGFSRKALLTNWVNNIILPSFKKFNSSIEKLQETHKAFESTPNSQNLEKLQAALYGSEVAWQWVAPFEFGKAEELDYAARMNSFPVDNDTPESSNNSNEDASTIAGNLAGKLGDKDLPISKIDFSLKTRADEQGLPALNYLLHGVGENSEQILNFYTTHANAANHKLYLSKMVETIATLTDDVHGYWKTNASKIIANDGSNATASVDRLINRFIQYIERGFREAKIATPAGYRTGTPKPQSTEAYYSPAQSKSLVLEGFNAIEAFYKGISFTDPSKDLEGIDDYLKFLNANQFDQTLNQKVELASRIEDIIADIKKELNALDANLVKQIEADSKETKSEKKKMLTSFFAIQKMVVVFKTGVMSSINVKIDFVDGDGD